LTAFAEWLADQRPRVLPKSPIGEAFTYATNQWPTLGVYLTDGRLAIDNGAAEQAIRPLAVGRRNWLHLGGDGGVVGVAVAVGGGQPERVGMAGGGLVVGAGVGDGPGVGLGVGDGLGLGVGLGIGAGLGSGVTAASTGVLATVPGAMVVGLVGALLFAVQAVTSRQTAATMMMG